MENTESNLEKISVYGLGSQVIMDINTEFKLEQGVGGIEFIDIVYKQNEPYFVVGANNAKNSTIGLLSLMPSLGHKAIVRTCGKIDKFSVNDNKIFALSHDKKIVQFDENLESKIIGNLNKVNLPANSNILNFFSKYGRFILGGYYTFDTRFLKKKKLNVFTLLKDDRGNIVYKDSVFPVAAITPSEISKKGCFVPSISSFSLFVQHSKSGPMDSSLISDATLFAHDFWPTSSKVKRLGLELQIFDQGLNNKYFEPSRAKNLFDRLMDRELLDKNGHRKTFYIERPSIKVTVLGNGNIFCRNNTSFIIDADRKYLVDCPPTLENLLSESDIELSEINNIILTHTHPDHFNGFEQFLLKKIAANKKINIYTTREIYRQARGKLSNWIRQQGESHILNFCELKTGKPYENEGLKIDIRDNIHEEGVPTIGFMMSYKGKTLGYSSDCKYTQQIESQTRDAYEKFKEGVEQAAWYQNPIDADPEGVREGEEGAIYLGYNWRDKIAAAVGNFKLVAQDIFNRNFFNKTEAEIKSQAIEEFGKRIFPLRAGWFSNCDMLIHEATDNLNDPVHTHVGELESLPLGLKSKMFLAHLPPSFQEHYAGTIQILKERAVYRI